MAAMLNRIQLCGCTTYDRPYALAETATSCSGLSSSSNLALPGARSRPASASASAWIPVGRKATVSLLADSSRHDSTGVVANVPRSSAPLLAGRSGRFDMMEGARLAQREARFSQRLSAVKETKVVIMVDPVEAKRLAAAEMKAIEARAKLKRRKEIEAINGGWAMVGLTAGIVIDGYTGKSILVQIAGYLDAIADYLTPFIPQ